MIRKIGAVEKPYAHISIPVESLGITIQLQSHQVLLMEFITDFPSVFQVQRLRMNKEKAEDMKHQAADSRGINHFVGFMGLKLNLNR